MVVVAVAAARGRVTREWIGFNYILGPPITRFYCRLNCRKARRTLANEGRKWSDRGKLRELLE